MEIGTVVALASSSPDPIRQSVGEGTAGKGAVAAALDQVRHRRPQGPFDQGLCHQRMDHVDLFGPSTG